MGENGVDNCSSELLISKKGTFNERNSSCQYNPVAIENTLFVLLKRKPCVVQSESINCRAKFLNLLNTPTFMRKFWLDNLIATLFTFAILAAIYGITQLRIFNAFDPLGKALNDMELTDIAFSQLREDPPIDTNVIIVNIGYLSRGEIGRQILTLNQFKPKVIALDIIFSCPLGRDSINCPALYDTLSNMIFASAVNEAGESMVLAEKLWQTKALVDKFGDIDIYDSIEHTDDNLRQSAVEGFVNLETEADHQEDLKVCRKYNPQILVNGNYELAFSTKIAMLYDSVKTKNYLSRNNKSEIINYRGNIVDWHGASSFPGRYMVLDWDQALDSTQFVPGMIKDKIVILGFLGRDLRDTSWDDKFITPLNKNYAGKTRPDMYGVVVHANAVSMILNEDYIEELSTWQEYLIAFIACMLNVALFSLINRKMPLWFDGLSMLVQLSQILLFSFLMIYFFYLFNFKLNLTITLAVIALAGTCFELYHNVIKRTLSRIRASRPLTKPENEVLIP
jgi:CHASE2 domain-containing sensor protein